MAVHVMYYICFFFGMAALACGAELFAIEAGVVSGMKKRLEDGFEVCPSSISSNGISVECVTLMEIYGEFSVNGKVVRKETQSPYTINGDVEGTANKWDPPAGPVSISCNGVTVKGTFDCDAPVSAFSQAAGTTTTTNSSAPAKTKPTLYLRHAGEINLESEPLETGFVICPSKFSATGISIECVDPTASMAKFYLNGVYVRTETWIPFSISGDTDAKLLPWSPPQGGKVSLTCTTNLGSSSVSGTFAC